MAIGKRLTDEQQAEVVKLRVVDGLSLKQVAICTGFSKSTIGVYCKGLRVNNASCDPRVYQPLATAKMSTIWAERRGAARQLATKQWLIVRNDPILLALVAFYWAEGTKGRGKNSGSFRFTNSDPGAVKAVATGLRKLGYIDTYIHLSIMPQQNKQVCIAAWVAAVNIPVTYVRTIQRRSNSTKIWSKYGVCILRVARSGALYQSIMVWINCWRSEMGLTENWQL